ncbi:hypothetical protein ABZY81_43805, partial [Streptomyces sp. NPDC006514]
MNAESLRQSVRRAEATVGGGGDVATLLTHGGCPSKGTLALQIAHNRDARGLQGVIFTRDDRAGEGKLSS